MIATALKVVAAGACLTAAGMAAQAEPIELHTNFPPLLIPEAPQDGAHPLGGLTMLFVNTVNEGLVNTGRQIDFHVTSAVPPSDIGHVKGPTVDMGAFETVYHAVAAGTAGGGVDMGVGIANQNGLSFGELHVAALPFGMEADEFAAYLYDGGGLALQQELYDTHYDDSIMVLPIAITPTQGGGWFPEALPDSAVDPGLTDLGAMKALCEKPWIVRWPDPGASVWAHACTLAGSSSDVIGAKTRCAIPDQDCPTASNPVTTPIDRLSFGGFVPGIAPHVFLRSGNIDAYELNLPATEVLMIKLTTGQADVPTADADLSAVIAPAPYYYGQTWHQTVTYLELLINKAFWQTLTPMEQWIITTAAESATLRSLSQSLALQGEAIDILEAHGAKVGRWPEGLLAVLREASDLYLDDKAARLAAEGESDYGRVLEHMRAFQNAQRVYADFGDANQGRAGLPTTP